MEDITIVLLDIGGIQEYVFGSNKLKENIGGSTLVKKAYDGFLKEAVGVHFQADQICFDSWSKHPERLCLENGIKVEVGYIGGGNALLLFKDEQKAQDVIEEWTRSLLISAPGLKTHVAVKTIKKNDLGKGINDCFNNELINNKRQYAPQVILPRHGITAECHFTGYSAEGIYQDADGNKLISCVSKTRFDAEENDHFKEKFKRILDEKECNFTNELDKLGQSGGESHIAIVHIDGNGIGQRFKEISEPNNKDTLKDLRQLSIDVQEATDESMEALLNVIGITGKKDLLEKIGLSRHVENGKIILPLRPLILAGDDITFVCDARLGFYCAEQFIKFFSQHTAGGTKLSACAGVAVIKTKYPFYRGYQLAEELCKNAKKKSRKDNDTSWLDFHVSYGGLSGELQNIRQQKYTTKEKGKLYWRPWRLCSTGKENDFNELKNIVCKMVYCNDDSKWPQSKLMDLRTALSRGKAETKRFIKMMKARKLILSGLPKCTSTLETDGWYSEKTPYLDVIEVSRFYPQELLADSICAHFPCATS